MTRAQIEDRIRTFEERLREQIAARDNTRAILSQMEAALPEMVSTRRGKLEPDDDCETDIQFLDQSNLILALVNAVKELATRVSTLEGN